MPTHAIAHFFNAHWDYGAYEREIFDDLRIQIDTKFPDSVNLMLNLTWHGPKTFTAIDEFCQAYPRIDNLFVISTVDYVIRENYTMLTDRIQSQSTVGQRYHLGNFDDGFRFNFFAIACLDKFKTYQTEELILRDIKHVYVSYSRKPYQHRLNFTRALKQHNLLQHGIVTLGRAFPGEPDHGLYMSIGERDEDYREWGHWYTPGTAGTPHEIPHDLYTLHNWPVWQHHFLHVVNATAPGNMDPVFVNQIGFKPLIGMRPFVINGQTKQYRYLHEQGFKTFERWWPEVKQEIDASDPLLHQSIIDLIRRLSEMPRSELLSMYNDMLPDLLYNRQRWYEWAAEQKNLVKNIFQ